MSKIKVFFCEEGCPSNSFFAIRIFITSSFFIFSFCLPEIIAGQNTPIDSLQRKIIGSNNDTLALQNALQAGNYNENIYPDSSLHHYKLALAISNRIALQNDFKSYALTKKADLLRWISLVYYFQGQYDSALNYYILSIDQNQAIGNLVGMAKSYNNIGVINSDLGDYSQAMDYHLKLLQLKQKIYDSLGVAASYNNIG